MIEIVNNKKHPVQIVIRSKSAPRQFTVLNIPGIGKDKNTYLLEDERSTEYVDRMERLGWISTRYIKKTENNTIWQS